MRANVVLLFVLIFASTAVAEDERRVEAQLSQAVSISIRGARLSSFVNAISRASDIKIVLRGVDGNLRCPNTTMKNVSIRQVFNRLLPKLGLRYTIRRNRVEIHGDVIVL